MCMATTVLVLYGIDNMHGYWCVSFDSIDNVHDYYCVSFDSIDNVHGTTVLVLIV